MHDRTPWTKGESGPLSIKGKAYKNLVEFTRPCATCDEPFSIYVTAKIAAGHADSNSFGLKNCEKHRRNKPNNENETLRSANVTMREELTGLYERIRELEARLAKYELPAAMAAMTALATPFGIGCDPVQNTTNGALPSKMPWE